jgi:hypothetical protein
MLWFKPTNAAGDCVAELCLLANPKVNHGNGRYSFVDIFFPSSSCSIILELKNASLEGIWRGQGNSEDPNSKDLANLREVLKKEEKEKLLKRKVQYRKENEWVTTTIDQLEKTASQQLTKYIGIMKNGSAVVDKAGISDGRVVCSPGRCKLIGYVVICVGGTRVLVSHVTTQDVENRFTIKGSII